ncbi:centromere protein N isoform X3 [Clinocottus analis]|uniref:centromere protein N isoform X3 n=1 Tax=Clinocottus analis TaxID=304258 RepID=UPI0035BECFAA
MNVTYNDSRNQQDTLPAFENELSMKHLTELEMIYIIDNPNKGMWYAFQLMDPQDDANAVELTQFKEQFKSHLRELVKHVSVKIKKDTDDAIWIRIAWGDTFSRPNHMKPTYVVHYLQSPYVFVTSLTSKQKPLLSQALVLSTRYQAIKDANLSGRKLTPIRDLLMRKYQQVFPIKYQSPLPENVQTSSNPYIEKEQAEPAANRLQMACEAFGGGMLPQLQSAVYKLETKFRDNSNMTMTQREEPFRCVVKFASTNLLESLRHCASSGIASTPVTPLLSCIPLKGRNYFVITDNGPGPSSQVRQPQN